MICIFLIFVIIVLLLLLNEYYFFVVLHDTQEHHILRGKKGKNYKWIAFGSSYCRYGLVEKDEDGINLGIASQFLYYSDKMLREYASKCLRKGGVVFIIIADLVFSEVGKGIDTDRYQLLLPKRSLGDEYSCMKWLKKRFPLFFSPFLIKKILVPQRNNNNAYYNSIVNSLTDEQVDDAAKKRCNDWCKQFGLKDTLTSGIPDKLEKNFVLTRDILTGMIQFCCDNGFKPVLVVTPVSRIMNQRLGEEFLNKVLYENIRLANKQNVLFLNYLRDDRFQDVSLYYNSADFLNARGRELFTSILKQKVVQ